MICPTLPQHSTPSQYYTGTQVQGMESTQGSLNMFSTTHDDLDKSQSIPESGLSTTQPQTSSATSTSSSSQSDSETWNSNNLEFKHQSRLMSCFKLYIFIIKYIYKKYLFNQIKVLIISHVRQLINHIVVQIYLNCIVLINLCLANVNFRLR